MTTPLDIFETLRGNNHYTIRNSYYLQEGAKLIRISDHMCNVDNLIEYNEDVEEVLFLFVNPNCLDSLDSDMEEVEEELSQYDMGCQYLYSDDNCKYMTMENILNKAKAFLND